MRPDMPPCLVIAIILLIISRFFLFPMVCQGFLLQIPGQDFNNCFFFRVGLIFGAAACHVYREDNDVPQGAAHIGEYSIVPGKILLNKNPII